MAAALFIKSGRRLLTPNIVTTKNFSRQDLQVTPTEGYTQKNWTTLSSIFTTNQSFLVSYPMTITVSPPKNHQVFINFRGDQLCHNFVSHLTNAFERHGIKFFVDNDEQRGKDLKNLFVRIEESKIALAIFSTRYPESKWCMNELVKMKKRSDEGKLQIIPIFYKVEPRDIRKPRRQSEFGKNFWKLMEASDWRDPIQKWREALECISNKMGLSLGDNSSESDFVKVIVKAVKRVNEVIELKEENNYGGKNKREISRIAIAQMKNTPISKSTFR